MNKILELKHWQLFLILMIAMFVGSSSSSWGLILTGISLCGWLFLLGMATNSFVPAEFRFSKPLFIFRLSFAMIYIVIKALLFTYQMPTYLMPIHIIATLFLFSCLWTCAKTVVVAESQELLKADRYIGTFFMLWFFPIGIWFVQPRLNRLLLNEKST